jgi:hypothetical protein
MPKRRTPEEEAEYKRTYRARRRLTAEPATDPRDVGYKVDTPVAAEKAMSALRRERTGAALLNPFDDGLPDTGYLIQQTSQKQRDLWLSRINLHKERPR